MKQHLIPEDFNDLSESQKQALRNWWLPAKHELAAAFICKDAENEEYDVIEFVIGDVIITENHRYHSIVLRKLRLADDSMDEENGELFENEGTFELEYEQPEDYFSKEDCLPLLNIGQMIELVQKNKYGQNGFNISIPQRVGICNNFVLDNLTDAEVSSDELCDALWQVLKKYL